MWNRYLFLFNTFQTEPFKFPCSKQRAHNIGWHDFPLIIIIIVSPSIADGPFDVDCCDWTTGIACPVSVTKRKNGWKGKDKSVRGKFIMDHVYITWLLLATSSPDPPPLHALMMQCLYSHLPMGSLDKQTPCLSIWQLSCPDRWMNGGGMAKGWMVMVVWWWWSTTKQTVHRHLLPSASPSLSHSSSSSSPTEKTSGTHSLRHQLQYRHHRFKWSSPPHPEK